MKLKPVARKIHHPDNLKEFENATKGHVYFAPFFKQINVVIPIGKSHKPPISNQLEIVHFIVVINTLFYPTELNFCIDKQVRFYGESFEHSRIIQTAYISAKNIKQAPTIPLLKK